MSNRQLNNITNHAEVSEKVIERYLVDRIKMNGLPCLKSSNPNETGYPDRLIVLHDGAVVWAELKSKGRKPSRIQELRIARLRGLGHTVEIIDNKADVDALVDKICDL